MIQHAGVSHAEAIANAVAGAVLAQLVLWFFGVPLNEALSVNAAMIGVSYARAFALRRIFARFG
jgi:phosphate/sulfate permease